MKPIIYPVFGCLMLLFACNSVFNSEEKKALIHIPVRKCLQNPKKTINMTNLYKSVKYIPLETTEEALLHGINKVLVHEDMLYVSDNRLVYKFDEKGNFVTKIGAVGSGPGEYIGMIRFTLDPVNNEILIYSTKTHVLNVYSIEEGNFRYSKEMTFYMSDFGHLDEGNMVFFTREFNKKLNRFTVAEAYLFDGSRELQDSISNFTRYDIENYSMGYVSMYPDNQGLNYIYNYKDTLYHINSNFQKTPKAWFLLDNNDESDMLDIAPEPHQIQYPDFLWISNALSSTKHYYITIRNGFAGSQVDNSTYILYSKDRKETFHISAISNDLDHGLAFWPRWIHNDKLISYFNAHEILSFVENRDDDRGKGPFWQIANGLNENDNPVLVIVE